MQTQLIRQKFGEYSFGRWFSIRSLRHQVGVEVSTHNIPYFTLTITLPGVELRTNCFPMDGEFHQHICHHHSIPPLHSC